MSHGKRPSYKKAVEEMCRACIYDPHQSGTWRKQVAACGNVNCPLFAVRPLPRNYRRNRLPDENPAVEDQLSLF